MAITRSVVEVEPPNATQSAVYRRASSKEGFPGIGVTTLYELFTKSAEARPDLPALGRRPIAVSTPLG